MFLSDYRNNRDCSSFDWPGFLTVTLAGSLISMALTGFIYATQNNLFHLPIVSKLYDEPQFANDSFIQSLRYYTSGIWLLTEGSARWIDPYWLFLCLTFFSRFLTFAGLIACATFLGITGRKELAVFASLLCTTYLLRGYSAAGGGGLFLNFFTHSDFGNGFFLLALYSLLQRRIAVAVALAGLLFFSNAFMGVWAAFVFCAVFVAQLLSAEFSWRHGLLHGFIGAIFASLIAAPIIAWNLSNPEISATLTFDYASYLNEYFPYHFIIEASNWNDRIALALTAVSGVLACLLIGKPARFVIIAMVAACSLYVIAVIAPYLTYFPNLQLFLLKLQMLRVGAYIHLLSALAIATLTVLWFFNPDRVKNVIASAIALAILANPIRIPALSLLAVVLAYALVDRNFTLLKRLAPGRLIQASYSFRIVTVIWILAVATVLFYKHRVSNSEEERWLGEWKQMATWASANTTPDSIFLVPVIKIQEVLTLEEMGSQLDMPFEFVSHRRIWVDHRRGGAVMWRPSYYQEWHRHTVEVMALTTHEDRLRYARDNGVSYVIELCNEGHGAIAIFAAKRLCVYPAHSEAQAGFAPRAN
ncbi:MAG: hypothetical protein ACLPWS_01395 [Rhodomicrobium sp.]